MIGSKLQKVTGWALIVAAIGVFWDAIEVKWLGTSSLPEGSWGLIPALLGILFGLVGLTLIAWRVGGLLPGLLAGLGTAATFFFHANYPSHATTGGLGALALGVSMLFMPGRGRLTSPLWVAAGVMHVSELVIPGRNWGPISAYTLLGASLLATGVFVLWGMGQETAGSLQEPAP